MKIKTSKVLAKLLNDNIKEFNIYQQKLTPQQFGWYVDCINSHDNDYDYKTDKYSVLYITYPANWYANTKYITTDDLYQIFKKSNKTLNGFIDTFKEEYMI